jgi:hypothetical protein
VHQFIRESFNPPLPKLDANKWQMLPLNAT